MVNRFRFVLIFGLFVLGIHSYPLRFSKDSKGKKELADKTTFSFDDLFDSNYQPKSFSSSWIEDALVYKDYGGNVVITDDVAIEDTRILVPNTTEFSKYWVASDTNHILLAYDVESQWRHSFTARYRIYNHVDGSTTEFPQGSDYGTRLQFAQWASTGLGIFYAKDNDLYYQPNPNKPPIRLTTNGEYNKISNGIPDWLYEEEIFSSYYATWWSPDTSHVIYAQFNTTDVPLIEFPSYGTKDNVYPELVQIPYPKAGDLSKGTNTMAQLFITNPEDNSKVREVPVPPQYSALGDYYFTQLEWINAELFYVSYSNRLQNGNNLYVYNASDLSYLDTGDLRIEDGWYDPDIDVLFINDGAQYLRILSKSEGSGSWKHLAIGDTRSTVDDVFFLTKGEEEVVSISKYIDGVVYFIATEGDRMKRHLNRINIDGTGRQCITCAEVFEPFSYFSVEFSGTGDYYILSSLGPDVPRYDLYRTSDHIMVRTYEDNTMFKDLTANKLMPVRQLVNLEIGGGEMTIAEVWTPEDLQAGEIIPLVVETYGGPGSQRVYDRYIIDFHTHLVSSERVAYAFVDGRGTAYRGDDFKFLLHRKLGTIEVEDQILAAQGLKDVLEFVNSTRTAIWGWSYGGYLTANVMGDESDVFSCGIIGAALSDRRQYDTAHTERFMDRATPEDNQDGYERGSVLNKVHNFQNKSILIVHGTADDNVHFFSTAQLVKSLTEAEIQFRFQMYTDENHYFLGGNRHLYKLFIDFLRNDCWNK